LDLLYCAECFEENLSGAGCRILHLLFPLPKLLVFELTFIIIFPLAEIILLLFCNNKKKSVLFID